MTRIYTLIGLLVGSQLAIAQEAEDTTRFKIGDSEVIIISPPESEIKLDTTETSSDSEGENDFKDKLKEEHKNDLTYWGGLSFGVSSMLTSNFDNKFQNSYLNTDPSESFQFAYNFAEKRIPFGTDHIGLVSGLGFSHARYGFKNNYVLQSSADSTWAVQDTTINFTKNQLRTWYFNVPILLEINTSKQLDNNFNLSLGVIGGVRLGGKLYQKYEVDGRTYKNKTKHAYNLNPFQLNATVRMAYRRFGLYANYSLIPLFENNMIEEAYPLNFGVTFNF